jgi:pimeloyl-ACP methyl ester carboxylesterase
MNLRKILGLLLMLFIGAFNEVGRAAEQPGSTSSIDPSLKTLAPVSLFRSMGDERDAKIITPREIDESQFVQIGGIDQFISIRGDDRSNPVILFLHGGPANAQSPFLREFAPWEKYFTVVNWDQRGSGKTYGKNGPATPGMDTPASALDRLTSDAIEVAEYASQRLHKRKIVLVGHSWGAILGLNVVKRRPDLFYAFVATGLPVSWKQSLEDSEAWARREAMSAHDETTLKALDQAASPRFDDMQRLSASAKYRMTPDDLAYLKMQEAIIGPSNAPAKGDAADWVAGGAFTVPKIMPIVFSFEARTLGTDFSLPIFVIQGKDDHVASFTEAQKYESEIRAPRKALIPIRGGHFACFTDPREFVEALRLHVLPLVENAGSK